MLRELLEESSAQNTHPAGQDNKIYLKEMKQGCESRLATLLHLFQIDLIVLAGWMRILSAAFLEQFPQHIINIHPAVLPDNGTGSTFTTRNGTQIPAFR